MKAAIKLKLYLEKRVYCIFKKAENKAGRYFTSILLCCSYGAIPIFFLRMQVATIAINENSNK